MTGHLRVACWVTLAVAPVAFGAAGCKPSPIAGASCASTQDGGSVALTCVDAKKALACDSGVWVEIQCRGPHGCAQVAGVADCDAHVAIEGDRCPPARSSVARYACSPDHTRALQCRDGHFALWRDCRGPEGCSLASTGDLTCDTTLGEIGDPCRTKGSACSVDRQKLLSCDGNTLVAASSCRGSKGCRFDRDAHTLDCDDTVAVVGDPCDRSGRITCGVDGKTELVCAGARYIRKRECLRSDCLIDGTAVFCD